jgi:MoaA/NifB/PqqE/SkfB family radical SAM enzyme
MDQLALRRKLRFWNTRLREWRMIARGLLSTKHPVLTHLIAIRRCNLSCAYCNEFDKFSKPIPLEVMFRRVDRLAALGTTA